MRIVFDNIMSKADALKAVAKGDKSMDIVTSLTPAEAKAFDGQGKAHIVVKNAKTVLALVFNRTAETSPWRDQALRKAMNMAVDREALLKQPGGGYGLVIPAFIQPGRFGFNPSLKPYAYDADAAAKAIKATHLADKPITIAAEEDDKPLVAQIGEQLGKMGLKVTQVGEKAPADMKLVWHFDWTPEYSIGVVHRESFGVGGGFLQGPDDPKFDAMADKLIATEDLNAQEKVVQDIEAYEYDQANVLFLYSPANLVAVSNRTTYEPYGTSMFEGAEIKLTTTKAAN